MGMSWVRLVRSCSVAVPCMTCRLKPLDIEFMKQLHHLVNIIPVIAKADTLTASELKALKLKVGNAHLLLCTD